MSGVAIVTDSTSDLDATLAAAYGIDVVPLFVNFGQQRFRDGVDLSRADFYARLRAEGTLPTTSQPTSAMFEDVFRAHVDAGRTVVCLTIMASISGTINAATAAAAQFAPGAVHVIDSESVSGGQAMQAMHAAELARTGSDAPAIIAALAGDAARGIGYATIPDLSHIVRTGRISRAQAFVGSLVKLVPVLRIDNGRIEQETRVRTFAKAQDAMLDAAEKTLASGAGARIVIIHTADAENAARLANRMRERMARAPLAFHIIEAGPAIATHAGPGALGIFVLPE